MAGPAHPARALPCPIGDARVFAHRAAGLVAVEAGTSGPEVFAAGKPPEAEAFVGEPHRAVGIALAGGDRVAEPRDQHVAHLNLGRHPLGRAVGQHDVDGGDRRLAVAHPELHLLDAVGLDRSRRAFAIVEAPDAALVRRQDALDRDPDAVVGGTEIRFAFTVAIAEFQEPAATVDAQSLDRVARPAAAVARGRQPLLGRQHAVSAGFDVAAEVGLAAEQAEAVLHLPFDPGAVGLGVGSAHAACRAERSDQGQNNELTHAHRSR